MQELQSDEHFKLKYNTIVVLPHDGLSKWGIDFATDYINEKVVGQTSFADCLHIAIATINRADFLISWNFKHIVNIQRIRGYNSINIKKGYKQLEIRSPREFENYEDD